MKPTRKAISRKTRLEIFERNNGICCWCGGKINIGEKWIVEHEIPFELGGSDNPEDLKLTHDKCAKEKTSQDRKTIARAKRLESKYIGATQPKQTLQSRGFPKKEKTPLIDKTNPPRRYICGQPIGE